MHRVCFISLILLSVGCTPDTADRQAPPANGTLIHNVTGYSTGRDTLSTFNYLHVDDDGRILAAGSGEHPPARVTIDGNGAVMLPGLIDAHGHVPSLGRAMQQLDLTGTRSLAEAQQRLRQYVADNPGLPVISGRGWNQELWDVAKFPGAADIDDIVDDRPVYLGRVDGHAAWVNSAALQLAGIDSRTPDPEGGQILRDASGKPTGLLVDAAMDPLERRLLKADAAQIERQITLAAEALLAVGITAVHDAGISVNEANAYKALHARDALPMRIYAMLAGIENQRAFGKPFFSDDERLTVRSIKLVSDGALGSRGALLFEPYSDDASTRGLMITSEAGMTAAIKEARAGDYQVNIHAIGDKANRITLNAFENAGAEGPERHRIEHAQVVALTDIERFKSLGIIPSMQATHATSDKNMAKKRVGEARLAGAYAWRLFLDQGSRIAGGSDFPVEHHNPFHGLFASVSRQGLDGEPPGGWRAEQRMTREEALRSFTLNAAYAAHMDTSTGSLEPGKWADFILVDTDIIKAPVEDIHATNVLQTWVAGKKVYSAPQ